MPNATLCSVSVPKELMERADRLMAAFPGLGLRTRGRFLATAIQEHLALMEERALRMSALEAAPKAPPRQPETRPARGGK